MQKPEKAEYDAYYERYVSLVDESTLFGTLAAQPGELSDLLGKLPDERGTFAYAEDKWSIKEVLGHLIDGERMFAYRILRISRADTTPIEGFEQDGYIENAHSNGRSIVDLVQEFRLLREANMFMLNNLNEEDCLRMGTASGLPVSVRALAYIMCGHIQHHCNILNERYLVK